jgi:hypothetical protein
VDLRRADPEFLIEISKDRGIFDADLIGADESPTAWARAILSYVEARSQVTASALGTLGAECRGRKIVYSVVTGDVDFDWTTGVDLWHLSSEQVDQVWTDTGDLTEMDLPTDVGIFHYLSQRSRYILDSYFESISQMLRILDLLADAEPGRRQQAMAQIRTRSAGALAADQLRRANVAALEFQGIFQGYVGTPLPKENVQKTVDLIEESMPTERDTAQTSAGDVVVYLMRLAQSGRKIDMEVLTEIGTQLGLFQQSVPGEI